jgi:hypothetical protein
MDTQSQERLAAIIATGPDAISAADAEFLRARRDYLNDEQKAVFAEALTSEVVSAAEAPSEADEKPAKTVKPAKQ